MKHILHIIILIVFTSSITASAQEVSTSYGVSAQAGHSLQINGIDLYYESYGEGDPLLLIHGNGQSIGSMAAQIEYFSASYNVIIADTRGHGKSEMGEGVLTYEQITEDLMGLLDHLKIGSVPIIGWSDGGVVGLHIASKYPSRVNKLVTYGANTYAGGASVYPWLIQMLKGLDANIVDGLKKEPNSADLLHQKQLNDLMMQMTPITPAMLQRITAPTLIMAGDKDAITNRHTIEIFEQIPNAHLAIMPGQTHLMPVTNPKAFNKVAADFLKMPFKRPTTKAAFLQ